jgi:hypothetical protein
MSRWAETFAALSRGVDTVDTSDKSAITTAGNAAVSRSVHSVTASLEQMAPAAWGEEKTNAQQ